MRRLLVRLVALQTTLVGLLTYWLFLVYANNPTVSEGLAGQLEQFPQLSFTTVDISVLIIIIGFSILIGYKLQRGLKPGIRLERALQMLESLMKRNLVLEAQVAELKPEKLVAPPPAIQSEPRMGSWDRVFKTPIEAGPTTPTSPTRPPAFSASSSPQTSIGLVRGSSKLEAHENLTTMSLPHRDMGHQGSPFSSTEKTPGKSPQHPSPSPLTAKQFSGADSTGRATEPTALKPEIAKSQPAPIPITISKQPYIPAPVPKGTIPPGVIMGPGIAISRPPPLPTKPGTKTAPFDQPKQKPVQLLSSRLSTPLMPIGVTGPKTSAALQFPSVTSKPEVHPEKESTGEELTRVKVESPPSTKTETKPETKNEAKPDTTMDSRQSPKSASKPLKKFPYEEEE